MLIIPGPGAALADGAFKANVKQILGFDGEFHRQLAKHLLTKTVNDHVHGIFRGNTPLPTVKELILADLRCRRFVLHLRGGVQNLEIRKGVRAAFIAEK
jgi:hypothetical protein